tara:strand:+ start:71 stop:256 length:186 start_codon:yes stop_codon:yes gene_type:complete
VEEPTIIPYIQPVNQSAKINGMIILIIRSRTAKTKTKEKGSITAVDINGWLSNNVLILFIL